MSSRLRGLYAITDTTLTPGERLLPAVAAAIEWGARVVQYRDKGDNQARREREASALLELCRHHGVPLLINDDIELAAAIDADGVHLGQGDATLTEARARLGSGAIIGITCHASLALARKAAHGGADYVAFGRFFPSSSKPQATPADITLLREARAKLGVPIIAIGGITAANGASLIEAGADMLAVIAELFAREDIGAAAGRLARLFD